MPVRYSLLVTARVSRLLRVRSNRKRIRHLIRMHDLQIPAKSRRRTGRAYTGRVATEQSNVRWCSDAFEIACWNGEIVQVGFALDCCDREALVFVAEPRAMNEADVRRLIRRAVQQRFKVERTPALVQWLIDNGSIYTALETVIQAEQVGLEVATIPAANPESNGMSEAFVNTIRRDYIEPAELALKMKSPHEFRAEHAQSASL